jgi:SAM-dependent methyltransferase
LLQQVYVESKYRDFEILRLTKKYLRVKNPGFLEYGCGIGPVTQTFLDFDPHFERSTFYLSDIKTVAFHFATSRFDNRRNVHFLPLEEKNNLQLQGIEQVDCIYCITVFEHLNAPMETIKRFHHLLPKGGLLFFDYIKGEGTGLDTKAGVRERNAVLEFVGTHFDILHSSTGVLDPQKSLGLTVVRKR